MPSVSNAGGSLSSAIVLTLLAWGVRWVRGEMVRRKREDAARQQERRTPGRFHASLSPSTLIMLVETGPYPHIVFDVRPFQEDVSPLPTELRGSLRLPSDLVGQALSNPSAWAELFQGVPFPETHYMLVFVGANSEQQLRAAAAAAGQGFLRTMTLAGSLVGFSRRAIQPHLHYINRDALAALLYASSFTSTPTSTSFLPMLQSSSSEHDHDAAQVLAMVNHALQQQRLVVIDVRRSDERLLFGHIEGTVHVPVDRLPSALHLSSGEFAAQYGFPKPQPDDLVVMSCRTNTRAAWAAAVAQDAGLQRCLVYKQGVYGWRLDPGVKVYRGYKLFDGPPEPEQVGGEEVDVVAGAAELGSLGILSTGTGSGMNGYM